jgi:hypothetical protein
MSGEKLGPIEIEFLLDKKADADAKNLKNSLNAIGTAGQKAADLYSGAVKKQIGLIADLEKSLQKLKEGQKNAHSIEEIEKYNKKIQEAEQDLKEYNEAGTKTTDTNNTISATLGKVALSLGGATVLLNALKKAFQETVGGMDLFNNVGAVIKQTLYDITASAGLSISRMEQAWEIQQKMNDLRLGGYVESIKATKAEAEFQQLYSDSLDANLSNADKITKINEALAAHDKAIDLQKAHAWQQLDLVVEARKNQPMNEKLIKEETDLINELNRLDAERVESTKRLVRQRSVLMKEDIDNEIKWRKDLHDKLQKAADEEITKNEDEAKKLKEIQNDIALNKVKGLDKELLKIKQQYEIDLDAYKENEEIKKALAIKYAQDRYEAEQKYLDKLKEDNLKIAESIWMAAPDLLTGSAKGKSAESYRSDLSGKTSFASSLAWSKDVNNKIFGKSASGEIADINDENIALEKQNKLRGEIVIAAADLVGQIGQSLGLEGEGAEQLNGILNTITNLASGDILGAVVSLLANIVISFPSAAKNYADEIERLNELLAEQSKIIEDSKRKGGEKEALQKNLDLLEEQKKTLEAAIARTEKSQTWFGIGQKANKKFEEQYKEVLDEIKNAEQEMTDFFAGGITENTLANAISLGFQQGKTSINDFAGYMSDVLRPAVLDIFSKEILGSKITDLSGYIAEALKDRKLSSAEKAEIDRQAKEIADANKQLYQDLTGVLGIGSQNSSSVAGSIKGVSEATASVVAGQMNAIRIGQASMNNAMQSSLKQLSEINANTSHLLSIDKKLDALNNDPLRSKGIV